VWFTSEPEDDKADVGFKQMFQDDEEAWDRGVHNSEGKKSLGDLPIGTLEPGAWTHQRSMTPEEIYIAAEAGEATQEINYLDLLKEHIIKGVTIKEIAAESGWSTNRVRKSLETGKRNYKKAAKTLGYAYSRNQEFKSSMLSQL
jgi:hypothetical protein